jgi:hypothetical protein
MVAAAKPLPVTFMKSRRVMLCFIIMPPFMSIGEIPPQLSDNAPLKVMGYWFMIQPAG